MTNTLKRLNSLKEKILSCVAIGDCRGALKGSFKKPILEITCPLRDHGSGFESSFARGRFSIARALLERRILPNEGLAEVIYQCTLCGSCREVCNNPENPCMTISAKENIGDHVEIWENLRSDLVDANVAPMPRHKELIKHQKKEHNPYFENHKDRLNWILKDLKYLPKGGDAFFFVGCTSAYRLDEISTSFLEIANKSKISLTVSPDERCCGSINLRTGTEALFKEYVEYNHQLFKNSEIEKIVTTCSGCYKTLSQDYPKYLDSWNFQVLHSLEMIDEAINQGNLKIKEKVNGIITYHDPCHLGRHSGIYDAPRNVIDAIKKDEFVEMRRNKKYSYCCGAGGGVKSAFPDLALEIALDRLKEAEETGADYLTSSCPFCLNNLREATTIFKTQLKVVDLLELVKKVI